MPLLRANLRTAVAVLLVALLAAAAGVWAVSQEPREQPRLGLLTTLPIYWPESLDIAEAIEGDAPPHWARTALEEDYRLAPLDTLDALAERDASAGKLQFLLLAQPRALSPSENVALDSWVRGGGRALIFADPLLTGHSRFAIGDRRRPQDVILLSPILRRWGIELQFDPQQSAGDRQVPVGKASVPVSQAGSFEKIIPSAAADCRIEAGGLVADCRIGEGRALVVADAALLDQERDSTQPRAALEALAARAFGS